MGIRYWYTVLLECDSRTSPDCHRSLKRESGLGPLDAQNRLVAAARLAGWSPGQADWHDRAVCPACLPLEPEDAGTRTLTVAVRSAPPPGEAPPRAGSAGPEDAAGRRRRDVDVGASLSLSRRRHHGRRSGQGSAPGAGGGARGSPGVSASASCARVCSGSACRCAAVGQRLTPSRPGKGVGLRTGGLGPRGGGPLETWGTPDASVTGSSTNTSPLRIFRLKPQAGLVHTHAL